MTATPSLSLIAAKYLHDALDIMEKFSINRHNIDWPTFRADILCAANDARTPEDTYPFIINALTRLNDRHSFFLDPQTANASANGTGPTPVAPEIKLVENKYGYVSIPGYDIVEPNLMNQYATDMQKRIAEIDRQHPCGWIVDLRGDTGGNMWPMLVGIGPILGEGKAGSWIDPDGNQSEWSYSGGKAFVGTIVAGEIIGEPYHLVNPDAPVAVLFGPHTTSAGEVIAISFMGRNNTRSFGSNSGGLTTANMPFSLSDNALICLTTAVDADRTGKIYGDVIVPDVQTNGDNVDAGPVPDEALRWLADQPGFQRVYTIVKR